MRLLIAVAMLFALGGSGGTGTALTPVHVYSVPSCHGLAAVPGYEKCHK